MAANEKVPRQSGALKQSTVNDGSPLLNEARPRGRSAPIENRPPTPLESGDRRVIVTEADGHRSKSGSTFRAPRKEGGGSPYEAGFTRMSMGAGGSTAKGNKKR